MSTKYDFTAKQLGVAADRSRDQYTAQIEYHAPGPAGHVYRAQILAHVRADSLTQLQALVADLARELTPA